jgi:hypothetical protein
MDAFWKSPEYTAVNEEMHHTWKGTEFEIKIAAQYEMMGMWGNDSRSCHVSIIGNREG